MADAFLWRGGEIVTGGRGVAAGGMWQQGYLLHVYVWSWGITRRTVSTPRVAQGSRCRDSGNETLGVVAGELKPVPELGLTLLCLRRHAE